MAANALVINTLQKRAWVDKMQKQMILLSPWESLSNRAITNSASANEKDMMPSAVLKYVSDGFSRGTMFTTIPSMDKLKQKGTGGGQVTQGTEENVTLRYARVYYNVKRKAVTFADGTVEGDAAQALPILSQKSSLLGDYFAELNDYDKQRASVFGADEFLTEVEYWTGSINGGFNTPKVVCALNPNTFLSGQTGTSSAFATAAHLYLTLSVTDTTGLGYACNLAGVAARRFTKARLDGMVRYAKRNLLPLNWSTSSQKISHVFLLSQETINQLKNDTTTSGAANWWATMVEADGEVGNRAITGIVGVYQNCLIIENMRSPLFNCNTDTNVITASGISYGTDVQKNTIQKTRFQFVKPWSDTVSTAILAGDNRVPVAKTDSDQGGGVFGTMEVNFIYGMDALGCAEIKKLSFNEEFSDYNFRQGFEARLSNGTQRMDFTNDVVAPESWSTATNRQNWSSAMFLVPTTAQTL